MAGGDGDDNATKPDSMELDRTRPVGDALEGGPLELPPLSSAPPALSGGGETAPAGFDAWTAGRDARRGHSSAPGPIPVAESTSVPPDPFATAEENSTVMALPDLAPDALDLVDRVRSDPPEPNLREDLVDTFALGDFSGAYRVAELLLGRDPEDKEAEWYLNQSHRRLRELLRSRLGAGVVPIVTAPVEELRWYGLDSRAVQLISHMDGVRNVEEVIASACLPEIEALRAINELVGQGIIRLDSL